MKTSIDFYIRPCQLLKPFRISRGEITCKDVLIVVFDQCFALELPLTPSNGEMPQDVLKQAKQGNISKMLKYAFSYYQGYSQKRLTPINPLKTLNTKTYSINDTDFKHGDFKYGDLQHSDYLQRFKGSPENIDYIINWTKNCTQNWAVDFNQSLTIEELDDFITRADLSKCTYLEQPLSGCHISPNYPVPIWIDEGLKLLRPDNFLASNFSGFMLKPLNYHYHDFAAWVEFAQKEKIPFSASGVVCDTLFYKFLEYLNQFATWQNIYDQCPGFFSTELALLENPYISGDFQSTIKEIKGQYNYVLTREIDIPTT